ncbi:MAG: NAD(P)-binding domain-containing protein [Nannocystaceae bacterium]
MSSFEHRESQNPKHSTDQHPTINTQTVILGAGPGGLQLAASLQSSGRDYLVLDAAAAAGDFFRHYPRHRKLLSINKIHTGCDDPETNLRWDWNSLVPEPGSPMFSDHSEEYFPDADALVSYLRDFAEHHKLQVTYGVRITCIERRGGGFALTSAQGHLYLCERLVVATGVSKPHSPKIPGIELAECYSKMSVDAADFAGQRVLIMGKGNSGFETADHLTPTTSLIHIVSPTPVKLAWKTHYVRHLRAINNNFLDTYQLKSQNAILDAAVRSIDKTAEGKFRVELAYYHADSEVEPIEYDRVLVCTGFLFDVSIFADNCKPQLTECGRLPAQTCEWESVNVPGLFFAGTLTQARDYRKAASPFVHGFRYNSIALNRVLEHRYHGQAWPSTELSDDPNAMSTATLDRLNSSSAIWQLFGFMCDVIAIEPDHKSLRYFKDVPRDYVLEGRLRARACFLVTLEFGEMQPDPFRVDRKPHPQTAADSSLLHPVVRHYEHGKLVGECHLLEELFAEWTKTETHHVPLRRFFEVELTDFRQSTGGKSGTRKSRKTTGPVDRPTVV